MMSRAFIREDGGEESPRRRYVLPPRDDPGYDLAAARALLDGARNGDTLGAEDATGYLWASPALQPQVERIRAWAEKDGDERLVQLAERFLRQAAMTREEGSE